MTVPPPPTPDFFIVGVSETQITSYVWVSGLTVIIYDTISTLPREVTYIWSVKRSLPTILYLSLRYWGLIQVMLNTIVYSTVQTSINRCHLFFGFVVSIGSNPFLLNLVNGILGLRLYALYGRNTHVLSFLSLLFAGEFAVQTYFGVKIGIATVSATFVAPPGVRMLGCLTVPPDLSGITIMWIVSISVTVICFIMTLAQFIHSAREAPRAGGTYRFTPLAAAFIKDGTVYFLAVVVTLTGGAITGSLVSGPFTILYEPWMAISLIVAGSRLVLNLRMAAACDVSNTRIPSSIGELESSNRIEFYNK